MHSFTLKGEISILNEILESIETSGLLDRLDRLYVINCGEGAALASRFDRLGGRLRLINFSRDATPGEAATLNLLRIFAGFHDRARILYLHTKGASHPRPSLYVADWRRLMLHFLVERHDEALATLATADAAGCNLSDEPRRHFSGNFWWANATYLKTLPPVPAGDRHEAEWWMLSGNGVRANSLHNSGVDHYRKPYGRDSYLPQQPFGSVGKAAGAGRLAATAFGGKGPSLCLVMIVRNESAIVTEALSSVLAHIADYVIVDTGSTDGTQEAIRRFFAGHGIQGQMLERPWRDFGSNRTEALSAARDMSHSDYLWMFDADDLLEGSPDFAELTADAYHLRFGPDAEYWRLQIFRRVLPWKYVGVLHEYPVCETRAQTARVEGKYQVQSRRLGDRSRDPDKYRNDAATLEAALARDPENSRHAFYLAQSRFDAGEFEKALEAYRRRISMGAWQEEVFYSRYRSAICLQMLGRPDADVRGAYEECFSEHPHRAEPLVRAARLAREAGDFFDAYVLAKRAVRVANPGGRALFVQNDDYEYRALDEQAIAAYYCDFPDEAFDLATELLDHRDIPDSARARIERNRDYAVPHLKDTFLRHDPGLVARLAQRASPSMPRVTLSVTSCRRLPLFIGTINSFLNACTDIDLIDRFVCVDDNSSEADRAEMQRRFPFFEFIWKGPADSGHAHSLNLIRQAVRTPWLIHLEDDWQFFARRPYIGPALEILEEDAGLGQVLFNRNYAETLEDREFVGGNARRTAAHGCRYVTHEHYAADSADYAAFRERHPGLSNAWWPHYSLRPSVLRTTVFERVGAFDEAAPHFEQDYAHRYMRAGFRSSFFDGIYSLHTGRLTRERGDITRANAYELNGQPQFGIQPTGRLPGPSGVGLAGPDATPPGVSRARRFANALALRVINLDRRPDRLKAFRHHVTEIAGSGLAARIERFAAIDGRTLLATPEIQHMFRGNDFGSRRNHIGCALSHLALWRQLAQSTSPAFLVLEDDVTLCPGFEGQLTGLCDALAQSHPAFDLLLLGYFDWQPRPEDDFETGYRQARLRPFEGPRYVGGTFAYLVSRRGAERLLNIVERDGIQNGIDRFVHRKAGELEILVATPHIARAVLAPPGAGLDSDIQNDFTPLSAPGSA